MTPHLSRLQWAVRAVLALGVAASVTANILHARDNLISQAIAAWPPLALLITVELVTRVPVYNKALGVARIAATAAIAGIAAWISYHHMVGVVFIRISMVVDAVSPGLLRRGHVCDGAVPALPCWLLESPSWA